MSQVLTWTLLTICIFLLVRHFMDIKDQDNGE